MTKAQAVSDVASRRGAKQPRVSSYLHKGRGLNLTRMRLAETCVLKSHDSMARAWTENSATTQGLAWQTPTQPVRGKQRGASLRQSRH